MSEFLPEAVRQELEQARKATKRRRTRMKVRTGGQEFTILRHWQGGFALDAQEAPGLRGLVDLYDHGKHVCQALIVATREEDGERVFEVKSSTSATDKAPAADFVHERPEPAGYLTRQ
ncbi:hypothetical protein CLV78_11025 [Aliiruegeria haliotis]|uniref:Uncharacterized protein n=1 Tax=Aliiruegeria haliotis TaxID=1280846 RepID=A0A2T0RJ52_9RHOB|nr:hypothetical protein [Aliiruegeria haliotis]PRY21152.1 hypothetical protein CLV78_11025 [Aliiruegeria haliotis]